MFKLSIFTVIAAFFLCAFVEAAPDLIINQNRLRNTIIIKTQKFSASSCAYFEQCVSGTGKRKLLKFDVGIVNIGSSDLILGDPAQNPTLFEFSACHQHYHLKSGTRYELLNGAGTVVVAGRKNAFCFEDDSKYLSTAGPSNGYVCNNQGITAGWQDVYPSYLDCQWIDITNIPKGNYTLRVTVNPDRVFTEANYSNNSATAAVTITGW